MWFLLLGNGVVSVGVLHRREIVVDFFLILLLLLLLLGMFCERVEGFRSCRHFFRPSPCPLSGRLVGASLESSSAVGVPRSLRGVVSCA